MKEQLSINQENVFHNQYGDEIVVVDKRPDGLYDIVVDGQKIVDVLPSAIEAGTVKAHKTHMAHADACVWRLNERHVLSDGSVGIIRRYGHYFDVDLEVNGQIINTSYGQIKTGSVKVPKPKVPVENAADAATKETTLTVWVGQPKLSQDGKWMRIVSIQSAMDILVKTEDMHLIHMTERDFLKGVCKPKSHGELQAIAEEINRSEEKNSKKRGRPRKAPKRSEPSLTERVTGGAIAKRAKKYVGKHGIATNGQEMVIIAYRRCDDIDVRFMEDGYIAEHVSLARFMSGNVGNPNKPAKIIPKTKTERVGETAFNRRGQRMTITVYKRNDDITVMFDDGAVREHVSYASFKAGWIRHPRDLRETA